jgi:hypothetical protein
MQNKILCRVQIIQFLMVYLCLCLLYFFLRFHRDLHFVLLFSENQDLPNFFLMMVAVYFYVQHVHPHFQSLRPTVDCLWQMEPMPLLPATVCSAVAGQEISSKFQITPSLFTKQYYCWNILWIITPSFCYVPVYIAHQLHCQDHARARSAATAMYCLAMRAPTPQVQAATFLLAAMEVLLMELLKLCKQNVANAFLFITVYPVSAVSRYFHLDFRLNTGLQPKCPGNCCCCKILTL